MKEFVTRAEHEDLGRSPNPRNLSACFYTFYTAKNLLAGALIFLCSASATALPLTWRADWPDAKPVETLVHRGTDIELQPLWRINKEPADTNGWTFTTFCQTNAVGPWFGPLPGACFSHTNDVGAAFYNVMVRAQTPGGAVNYTAFARLRMLDSPGFSPGKLPLPVSTIDFSEVVALHAPWTLQTDFSAATNTLSAAIGGLAQNLATVSNAAVNAAITNALQDAALAKRRDKTDLAVYGYGNASVTFPDGFSVDYKGFEEYRYDAPTGGETITFLGPVPSSSQITPRFKYYYPSDLGSLASFAPEDYSVWCLVCEDDGTIPQYMMYSRGPLYFIGQFDSETPTLSLGLGSDMGGAPTMTRPIVSTGDALAKVSQVDVATDSLGQEIQTVKDNNAQTRQIVTTWENFLDGSNVVFSVTNYISGTYSLDAAKMKILELRDGEYKEVYNSRDEILLHIQDFKNNDFKAATNQVIGAVNSAIENKADRDWGKYTSAGGEAPENTVYMTAPNTVFAGGLEYERVAVGEGTICVLTTHGAPVWTQGDEGTFKFQDDGGTNYFGFAKTDSYTIGANTDGISVQNQMVTLTYNITMSGRPCVWYKADLSSNTQWEQLNLPDGSAVAGASHAVTWEQNPDPGTQVCYINVGNQPQGFFRATIEVAGEAKFMTNMPAELFGGIICPNTATGVSGVIKPSFNGSSVIWTWSEK